MMRSLFVLLAVLIAVSPCAGEEQSPLGMALKDIEVGKHWIYDDFPRAVAEAKASGRPLLVVVRCVPCPPGQTLDEQVMRPDAALEAIEKKFVCVRLIQANSLDLAVFQYDFDMSWAGMFLNSEMTVYGRYGSRNAGGKDSSDGLLSLAAFQKAAERALALHAAYPGNKAELAGKQGPPPEYATPRAIPGLAERPAAANERKACIHCHMVKEFALRAKWEQGRLAASDLYVFPLPTNLGFSTELADGLRIDAVTGGSVAERAGLKVGDELVGLKGQPLVSLADIQWALHRAPASGSIPVKLKRDGQVLEKTLTTTDGWKKSDIAWRASSWYGLRKGLKFEALPAAEKMSRGIGEDRLAMVVKGIFGQGEHAAKKAGLAVNDVIVAMDGKSAALTESELLVALRLNHGPKDVVKFTVLRGSDRKELVVPMW